MKNKTLVIKTDDAMSMTSELKIEVCKVLNVIELTHIRQSGSEETIRIFPSQVPGLVEFLTECNDQIKSGYKNK